MPCVPTTGAHDILACTLDQLFGQLFGTLSSTIEHRIQSQYRTASAGFQPFFF